MTEYPWWEEVPATAPVMQGDIVEACPVSVFKLDPPFTAATLDALLADLQGRVGIQRVRSIIMTQACDLAEGKVQYAILCPAYTLSDFRKAWDARRVQEGKDPNQKGAFENDLRSIRTGKVWNQTLLRKREAPAIPDTWPAPVGGRVVGETTVVDFHEVFSLPVGFIQAWVAASGQARLRLAPPYREHLSQAFARFFMRVGLPVDIDPANL